mmetsp:Transcript_43897/g.70535  ORF Transcript_43897/g.70535 Transcript_43897/m.70535 type:complete len:245 (+) Transcript_43897:905-1639(+)
MNLRNPIGRRMDSQRSLHGRRVHRHSPIACRADQHGSATAQPRIPRRRPRRRRRRGRRCRAFPRRVGPRQRFPAHPTAHMTAAAPPHAGPSPPQRTLGRGPPLGARQAAASMALTPPPATTPMVAATKLARQVRVFALRVPRYPPPATRRRVSCRPRRRHRWCWCWCPSRCPCRRCRRLGARLCSSATCAQADSPRAWRTAFLGSLGTSNSGAASTVWMTLAMRQQRWRRHRHHRPRRLRVPAR